MVDDRDFAEGFRQGFKAARGGTAIVPPIPPASPPRRGRTPFQMGVARGVERGKGWDRGDLFDKDTIS